MQTITGKLRLAGSSNVRPDTLIQITERRGSTEGNTVTEFTSNNLGEFSFSVPPGSYFLRVENDVLPITVKVSSGSTTIDTLVEAL